MLRLAHGYRPSRVGWRGRREFRIEGRVPAASRCLRVGLYSLAHRPEDQHFWSKPMTTHPRNFPSIDPSKLDRLAEAAVKVGLRLQPGQDLFLTAPVAALPLARRIVAEAYKVGAGLVTPILSDEEMTLARFRFGPDACFDRAPGWLYDGVAKAFAANTARLAIVGEDPMLLANEDPAKVARASKANSIAYQPALEKIAGFDINWNLVAYPTDSWAKRVFPGESDDVAVGRLAEAIFSSSRVDNDDP